MVTPVARRLPKLPADWFSCRPSLARLYRLAGERPNRYNNYYYNEIKERYYYLLVVDK